MELRVGIKTEGKLLDETALPELISLDNFESKVAKEKRPVLLACIRHDHEFKGQKEILKAISSKYGEILKVCLLDEDSIRPFMKNFEIEGTPTFLIFHEGKEKGRILGLTDIEKLTSFIIRNLPHMGTKMSYSKGQAETG
jgi:thioredoxin-like negative regulator of GroEL